MNPIDTTITHGVDIGSAGYPSPLTITSTGAVDVTTDYDDRAVYGLGGTLVNQGTVDGVGTVLGIYLPGGVIDNSGFISGYLGGINFGADVGTLTNSGTIQSTGDLSYFGSSRYDVTFGEEGAGGGTLFNEKSGDITGGVGSLGGPLTVTNLGTITNDFGQGISLNYGGTVTDAGIISSSGPIGPDERDYDSIYFGGTFFSGTPTTNLLNLEAGYSLTGEVQGSDISGSTNTLELTGSAAAPVVVNFTPTSFTNFNDVEFAPGDAPNYAKLVLALPGDVPSTITGFMGPDDVIDLSYIGDPDGNATAVLNPLTDVLTVIGDNGTATLQLDTSDEYSSIIFNTTPDGSGTDVTPPCFCAGTLIATSSGEVAVEALAIGDRVMTVSGEAKPIKWIGRRSYDGRFIRGQREVLPIVVRAEALAPEVPARDLWLSPGHALLFDGVMVAVEYLVNGLSIVQAEAVERVEYFHLEFEAHEVVLAEGAAAESYVECDNRRSFHNAHEFTALYPDDARLPYSYCLPRLEAGTAELAALREQLFERAEVLGYLTTPDPDLHLVVDGRVVASQSAADGRHTFGLDALAEEVWLASRCGVPAEMTLLSDDRRRLGVCVQQLVLRDDHVRIEIAASAPSLCEGFHQDEDGAQRWTTGMARIPERFLRLFAGGFTVEVDCVPPLPRYPLHHQTAPSPLHYPLDCVETREATIHTGELGPRLRSPTLPSAGIAAGAHLG